MRSSDDRTHRSGIVVALSVFGVWTLATFLLEGAQRTLLRPDATGLRAAYTWLANYGVGIGLSLVVIHVRLPAGRAGFGSLPRALAWTVFGTIVGGVAFVALAGASPPPVALANIYAQVLSVSIAEVVVCWALLGVATSRLFSPRHRALGIVAATLVASVAFGVYHFAHSPPFDTIPMVARLTAVGVVTGAFFFVSRDVYGTIAFHNWLGVIGVTQSLGDAGKLSSYLEPKIPLLVTALVGVVLLAGLHARWLGEAEASAAGGDRRHSARTAYELLVGAADVGACVASSWILRGWYNRWGATPSELGEALPGDALVPEPKLGYTRAITIDAPVDEVWRWLVQFGQARGGFYSYDALENLVGCRIRSVHRIVPEHQTLQPGDRIRSNPGDEASWEVIEVDAPHHLVLMGADPTTGQAPPVLREIPDRGYAASTWQWVLRRLPDDRTRLIVRQRLTFSPTQRFLWRIVEPFNFAMEREMMRGIAARAERSHRARSGRPSVEEA